MRCIWGHRARKIYYREEKVKISFSLLHNPFHSLHLSRELWRVEHEKRTTIKLRPRKMLLWKVYSFFSLSRVPFFLHHPYSVYEHSLIMMQLARLWLQNDTVCARRPFLRSFFWDLDKSLVHISVECSFVFRPLFGSSCCNCTLFSHHKFHRKNTHITSETRAQRLSVGSTLWSPSSCYLTWAAQKRSNKSCVHSRSLFSGLFVAV